MVQSFGPSQLDGYDFTRIKAFCDQYYSGIPTGFSDGDVIIWDGTNGTFDNISRYNLFPKFCAHRHTGTISITTTTADLTFDAEVKKDSIYTHTTGAAGVTVGEDGLYQVEADIGIVNTAGTTASYVSAWLAIGTTEIDGTRTFANATTTRDAMSINKMVTLAAAETLNVRVQLNTAGNTITTVADAIRLTMTKVGLYTPSGGGGSAMGGGALAFITYP